MEYTRVTINVHCDVQPSNSTEGTSAWCLWPIKGTGVERKRKVVMERKWITERHSRRPVLVLEVPIHFEDALVEVTQLLESRGAQVYEWKTDQK